MGFNLNDFIETELGFTPVKLAIIGVLWLFVFLAMFLDLISGLRKAKLAGIATQSELLRRTTDKVIKNYSALAFMLMFDTLFFWVTTYFEHLDLSVFPLPSIVMASFEIFVEYKSVRENVSDKLRNADNKALHDLIKTIAALKNNEISETIEMLANKTNKDKENESEES